MAKGRTTRIKSCGQCGKGYEWRYGETLYRGCCSKACLNSRAARNQAAWQERNRPPRQCVGCGVIVAKRVKRCVPCNAGHYRAYYASRWLEKPKWDRQEQRCDGCRSAYVPHVPTQRYCSKSCRAKADSRKVSEARPLYRYARWLRIRREQLEREPQCRFCTERAATVCDHVVPHRGDVDAFWAGPFQSLCTECHSRDKQRMECRAA
jgi:hypothetical protein